MEEEQRNREKVREVETAWRKRSQADQPTVLPSLEPLTDTTEEPGTEKPPPHSRPLRRSHTDPTDLLWVFRRRASLLTLQNHQDVALPRRKNGFSGPYNDTNDDDSCETRRGSNDGLIDETTHGTRCDSHSSQDDHRKESATEEKAVESSSDSETKDDTPYEWTAMVSKTYLNEHHSFHLSCQGSRSGDFKMKF